MKKQQIHGFTLVELVVVATILAILGAVGFVSYTGYISGARDANRIAQLENIRSGLQSYAVKGNLPLPSDYVTVNDGTTVLGYQGYADQSILETIGYQKGGIDPKDDSYYTYYLSKTRNSFQLLGFLEEANSTAHTGLVNKTHAVDYSTRFPTVTGENLGILLGTGVYESIPIQEIETIKIATSLDIGSTSDEYNAIIKDDFSVVGNHEDLGVLGSLAKTRGRIGTNCKDLIDSNSGLLGQDGLYVLSQDGDTLYTVDCNMTYDGGGWTQYTQSDSSGYQINNVGSLTQNFNKLFYSYKRDGSEKYAFKFTRFYTKQCENEYGDVNNLKSGLRNYIDHIENASWGVCGRTSTTGDTNDIAIEKIIGGEYVDDPCLTGTLNKTGARNTSWTTTTSTDGRTVGTIQHRISNKTVLFGPQGNGSSRCAGSSAGPSASEVHIYLK